MVKIYNIHSNTISKEDIIELKKALDKGQDIFMLNEDIRYEVIDFDKMSVMKSKNYTKNIYAIYIFVKGIFRVFKVFKELKRLKNLKLPKFKGNKK